jgi:Caspase domain
MISRTLPRNPHQAVIGLMAVIVALLFAFAAHAEESKTLKGVALVIGQSKYAHITPLANPANDARQMSKLLTDMGFDARSVSDRDTGKLQCDLERFAEDAEVPMSPSLLFRPRHRSRWRELSRPGRCR